MTTKQGDRALLRTESFLYMQRLPRALFFILAHTESELRRVTHGRLGDLLRLGAANVHNNEAQRTSDGRVGAKPMSQGVVPAIHADLLANRPVDNRQWRSGERGHVEGVSVELLIAKGFDCSQDYRKIRRMASGHDRIDCYFLNRSAAVIGTDRTDYLLRVTVST